MKKIIRIIVYLSILIIATGCSNKDNSKQEVDKIVQEIEFLDTEIISMLNILNGIFFENYTVTSKEITVGEDTKSLIESSNKESSTDEKPSDKSETQGNTITVTEMVPDNILISESNQIDWKLVKNRIEILNSSWSIIILDLYNKNVENTEILNFSTDLDKAIISIKEENKTNSLVNLAKLYSYIPKYLKAISAQNSVQNITQTKSNIINAYSLVEQKNWDKVAENIKYAETSFKNVINDIEYTKNKEYKVNKTYVLIKELQNSLSIQDDKIFYMKYKNLMESLNSL